MYGKLDLSSKFLRKSNPAAKSWDPGENTSQPIALKQSTIILAVSFAVSTVIPLEILY